jgi:hypothetical protein
MMLKRLRPAPQVVHRIRKRSNHVTIVLGSINNTAICTEGGQDKSIGNRLGTSSGWDSNWYGGNDYGDKLAEITKSESISMLVYQKLVYQSNHQRTLKLCNRYYHYC